MQKEITIEQIEPGRFVVKIAFTALGANDKELSEEHYRNALSDAIEIEYKSTMVDFTDSLKWEIYVEKEHKHIKVKFEAIFPVRGMSLYSDNPEQDEISDFLLKASKVLQRLRDRFFDPITEQRVRERFEMMKV